MKKTTLVNILLALVLCMSAFAAEEDISVMNSKDGARLRFLQLEASLEKNIDKGELILEEILSNDPDADIDRPRDILEEMELIIEEIQDIDYNQTNSTELTKLFVIMKKEAVDLTNEFRQLTKGYLSEQKKEMLRIRINETVMEKNQGAASTIRSMIRQHNAQMISKMENRTGLDMSGIRNSAKAGTMDPAIIRSQLKDSIENMQGKRKNDALSLILEDRARNVIFSMDAEKDASEDLADTLSQRGKVRMMLLNNSGSNHISQKGNGDGNGAMGSDSRGQGDGVEQGSGNGAGSSGSGSDSSGSGAGSGSSSGSGSGSGSTGSGSSSTGSGSGSGSSSGSGSGSGSTGSGSGSAGSGSGSSGSGGGRR